MHKMSMREARQRCEVHGMRIQFNREWGEYRVSFPEDRNSEPCAYYTDDIEDAVITAGSMRHARRTLAYLQGKQARAV